MSEREELVKRLKWWAVESCGGQLEADLNAAIATLSAQPQGVPVALGGYWWCPNCKAEIGAYHVTYQECHEDCGHKVEWITPVTAPPSGVREGMLLDALQRAQSVMRGEVTDDQGKAWDMCAEILDKAITRAAEQVNAEQTHVRVPVEPTLEMIDAAAKVLKRNAGPFTEMWKAMLRAATDKESAHGK